MEWISIKDRLPESEYNVLAFMEGQVHIMAYFPYKEDGFEQRAWGYVYDGPHGDAGRHARQDCRLEGRHHQARRTADLGLAATGSR